MARPCFLLPASVATTVAALSLCSPATGVAKREQVSDVRATVPTCQSALDQAQRAVEFSGEMINARGADRMQIRFVLQAQGRGVGAADRWVRIKAPGFGVWNTSDPRVKRYQYTKRVENLLAPARYRVRVSFRWLGLDGRVLREDGATSPACRQPDLRPNLVPGAILQTPTGYAVPVRNTGPTPAAPFQVTLNVNGAVRPAEAVPSLAPNEQQLLAIAGPPCTSGTEILVTVDSGGAVPERDEGDNMVSLSCS